MIQYGILPLFLMRKESGGSQFAGQSRETSAGMATTADKGEKMMKKAFTWTMTLAAVFSAISLFADREGVLTARDYTAWTGPQGWQFDRIDGYLTASGPVNLSTTDSFMVYKDAEYELSGFFRTPGGQSDMTRFLFGFDPIDGDGNLIPPVNVCAVAGTSSVLAAPTNTGNPFVQGPGNGNWQGNGNIAFQGGQNFSGLPNMNPAAYYNDGESMVLSLRNPMNTSPGWNYNPGRSSARGGLNKAPYGWTRFATRVKGAILLRGTVNVWFPGTAQAKIFIFVPDNLQLDIRDISVTRFSN